MSSATTRTHLSDTIDVQALADWQHATSADITPRELRTLAKRYLISVRPGAGIEAIQEQLRRVLEPRIAELEATPGSAAPASTTP